MVATRQPLVLNNFLRAVRSCRPTTYRSIRAPPSSRSELHSTSRKAQTAYPNRYGPAATDSLPPPPKPQSSLESKKDDAKPSETEAKQSQSRQPPSSPPKQRGELAGEKDKKPDGENSTLSKQEEAMDKASGDVEDIDQSPLEQAEAKVQAQKDQEGEDDYIPTDEELDAPLGNKELDMVLSIPAPSEIQSSSKTKHPHLEPSPYEHHFDTYSLVQDLASASDAYTEKQAVTIMKAIRLMLSINLELAKDGLVSKSDVENESYLFRAACSELRTTLETTRASENQRQRTQRGALQHEMDLLNQKVTQDLQTMREELKGMFNDRKMGLQDEKRKIDSQISELNYEITVLLNSEAKSEVEGLRWVLTRRAALAIGGAALMILSALQYSSAKSKEMAEVEKKRAAALKAQEEKMATEQQARYTTPSRNSGTQTEYEESLG